jgi:chromosome partitioning protein
MLTIRDVRRAANPALRIEGIVLTMHDRRNRLTAQVEADARANMGELVMQTTIPRNVRISEAPSHAMSILRYDPKSRGAQAYRALAREIMKHHKSSNKGGIE